MERLLSQITSQEPEYQYFKAEPGNGTLAMSCSHTLLCPVGGDVALLVNNLGGTSNLELLVVTNAAVTHLGWYDNKMDVFLFQLDAGLTL